MTAFGKWIIPYHPCAPEADGRILAPTRRRVHRFHRSDYIGYVCFNHLPLRQAKHTVNQDGPTPSMQSPAHASTRLRFPHVSCPAPPVNIAGSPHPLAGPPQPGPDTAPPPSPASPLRAKSAQSPDGPEPRPRPASPSRISCGKPLQLPPHPALAG